MQELVKNRWLILVKGISLILLGLLIFIFPGEAILSIIMLFAFLLIISGAVTIYWAFVNRAVYRDWVFWLIEGILNVAFGVAILYDMTVVVFFFFVIGWWAVIIGGYQILLAIFSRWHRLYWVLCGLLTLAIGIILLMDPFAGVVITTYFLAIQTIVLGSLIIYFALELRKLSERDQDVLKLDPKA